MLGDGDPPMDAHPPRVFCAKSSELVEKVGDSVLKTAKEFGRVSRQKRSASRTTKKHEDARRKTEE